MCRRKEDENRRAVSPHDIWQASLINLGFSIVSVACSHDKTAKITKNEEDIQLIPTLAKVDFNALVKELTDLFGEDNAEPEEEEPLKGSHEIFQVVQHVEGKKQAQDHMREAISHKFGNGCSVEPLQALAERGVDSLYAGVKSRVFRVVKYLFV